MSEGPSENPAGHAWRRADTHSPEALEVLGKPPPWLVRWGMALLAFGVAVALAISWMIRLPEVIKAPVVVTTEPAPTELLAAAAGVLRLDADHGTLLEAGAPLAVIEPPGVIAVEVEALAVAIAAYRAAIGDSGAPPASAPTAAGAVGEELRKATRALLSLDREMRTESAPRRPVGAWLRSLKEVEEHLEAWRGRRVLTAPTAGRFFLAGEVREGRRVTVGEVLGTLIPSARKVIALARLNPTNVSRIEEGQRALIRLPDYPPAEFGHLEARVGSIAPLAQEGSHRLELALPAGPRTSLGHELDVPPEISGEVEILVGDLRLWDRLFGFLRPVPTGDSAFRAPFTTKSSSAPRLSAGSTTALADA